MFFRGKGFAYSTQTLRAMFRTSTRSIIAFFALLIASLNAATGQVLINEFSAANYNAIADNFGEYEDWVELYNPGSAAVDLGGYHLSDRADEPTKWAIPTGVTIPAGGHLRFWCSSRNISVGSHNHTNFKITQTRRREGVYFNDPAGVYLDSNGIAVPNQSRHSWGRTTDGAGTWSIFTNPTPAAVNSGVKYNSYATTPVVSPEAGLYGAATSVTVTTPDAGVTLRYTTNGDIPIATSTVYAGPINVAANTVVRVTAFSSDPGIFASFTETNTYFIGAGHTLPVMSIAGNQVDDLLNGSFLSPVGSFELFNASGSFLTEAVGDYNEHGNDSWAYPQRGIDYITRDQMGYANDVEHQIFRDKDRDQFQRLILKAAANDNYPYENGAHIRDAYVHALSHAADLRVDERTYEPAILYVNGQYWGMYEIREKVDDADFTSYYYDQDEFNIDFLKTWGGTWEEYGSRVEWDALFNYILTNDMADPANFAYVDERYNVGSLIDYTILHSWVVCMDWLNWNTAWWRGRNPDGDKKKWRYALWDDDATFGHYFNYTGIPDTGPTADPCDPTSLDGWSDPEGHMALLNKLQDNEDFRDDYINRYSDLTNWYFNCDFALPFLDSLIDVIRPEMPAQIARWTGSVAGWEAEVTELRDFIIARCGLIVGGMEDCFGEDAWPITLQVDPPLSGEITINTLEPPYYPFNAVYLSGVELDLTALELDGWTFDRWELNNNVVLPGTDEPAVVLELVEGDTITAHFRLTELPAYNIHVVVQPPGAGTVTINALEPISYPWDGSYLSGSLVSVTANPASGYVFRNWNLYHQFINPSATDANGYFAISTGDTLEAYFETGTGLNDAGSPLAGFSLQPTVSSGFVQMSLSLERAADVELSLFTPTGQRAAVLQPVQTAAPGLHTLTIDLSSLTLPAGLYLIVLRTDGFAQTEKVVYAP